MTTPATVTSRPPARAYSFAEDAMVERSAAIIQAAGFRLIPLLHPIGPWQLLAASPQGLLLVSVLTGGWPELLGPLWALPAGWPFGSRRLVHRWPPDAMLPDSLAL